MRHCIDAMWCDVEGVYVRGWAHAEHKPIVSMHLRCGDRVAPVEHRHARPDVEAAFPNLPRADYGFACYLPCPPFQQVMLGIATEQESGEFELAVPTQAAPAEPETGNPLDRFIAAMKERRGSVIEIGARTVSPGAVLQRDRFAPECAFTGVDIHAALGVDIVADAHFLSSVVAPGSVDGVFSMAVMEHLVAPWLVAAEINRVLKPGGLTFHIVPHSWPVHEMPNDFWRMSHEGLKVIFGAATGFEVIEAGMSSPMQIVPHASMRQPPFLDLPLCPGMGSAHIIARKVRTVEAGAIDWSPAREVLETHSRHYPSHAA